MRQMATKEVVTPSVDSKEGEFVKNSGPIKKVVEWSLGSLLGQVALSHAIRWVPRCVPRTSRF